MMNRTFASFSAGLLASAALLATAPAHALTMQECSAKYNAAKAADKLGGKSWNDFRKSECGETAAAAPATPSAPATRPGATVAAGKVVFPRAIDTKYAAEKASKQRMNTCLDQYNANKANGGNGELKWIQKGGGYYSQCNARLKGQTGA